MMLLYRYAFKYNISTDSVLLRHFERSEIPNTFWNTKEAFFNRNLLPTFEVLRVISKEKLHFVATEI